MENKSIVPNWETIGVAEQRHLFEIAQVCNRVLSEEDFLKIVKVYQDVIDRLAKLGRIE